VEADGAQPIHEVPQRATAGLVAYVQNRSGLMRQIEQQDVSQVTAQEESRKQK